MGMKYYIYKEKAIVYEDGRVFSINSGKFYKQYKNNSGYLGVTIGKEKFMVHRLIAMLFIENPKNLPVVDHIDANKENNHYLNLQWTTVAENIRKSYKDSGVDQNRNFVGCGLYKGGVWVKDFDGIKRASIYANQKFGASISSLRKHGKTKDLEIIKKCNDHPKGE